MSVFKQAQNTNCSKLSIRIKGWTILALYLLRCSAKVRKWMSIFFRRPSDPLKGGWGSSPQWPNLLGKCLCTKINENIAYGDKQLIRVAINRLPPSRQHTNVSRFNSVPPFGSVGSVTKDSWAKNGDDREKQKTESLSTFFRSFPHASLPLSLPPSSFQSSKKDLSLFFPSSLTFLVAVVQPEWKHLVRTSSELFYQQLWRIKVKRVFFWYSCCWCLVFLAQRKKFILERPIFPPTIHKIKFNMKVGRFKKNAFEFWFSNQAKLIATEIPRSTMFLPLCDRAIVTFYGIIFTSLMGEREIAGFDSTSALHVPRQR